jgi:hypothetical protein
VTGALAALLSAVAGNAELVARSPIRANLQARAWLSLAPAEQPPAPAPSSLPVRTTRGNDGPASVRAARFRFDPVEQECGLRLEY